MSLPANVRYGRYGQSVYPPVRSGRLTGGVLIEVHAHPDDESTRGGGKLARYAFEGAAITLVTCTNGDQATSFDPTITSQLLPSAMAKKRRSELDRAVAFLGIQNSIYLGYPDSGTDFEKAGPNSFARVSFDEIVQRLVRIIRNQRPHIVVAYPEGGHPDHDRVSRATHAAIKAAANPNSHPESEYGRCWLVNKFYYSIVPEDKVRAIKILAHGLKQPSPVEPDQPHSGLFAFPDERRFATTTVDARAFWRSHVIPAMKAHVSQIYAPEFFLTAIDPQVGARYFGVEHYQLVSVDGVDLEIGEDGPIGRDGRPVLEYDLFSGLFHVLQRERPANVLS